MLRKKLNLSGSRSVFRARSLPYLVRHFVNFILVAAVTQVHADLLSSALLSQSGRFLHSILVNVPQNQHRVKSGKLQRHEAANPTACTSYQHQLPRYVLLLDGHKEVDEWLHIVPDGEQEDLNCFHEKIHFRSRKKRETLEGKLAPGTQHLSIFKVYACGSGCKLGCVRDFWFSCWSRVTSYISLSDGNHWWEIGSW